MRRFTFILAMTLCFALPTMAQEAAAFDYGLVNIRFYGLDGWVSYDGLTVIEGAKTSLYLRAGGGYQDKILLRDDTSGEPSAIAIAYKSANVQWDLGLIQGFVAREDGDNLIEAFLLYRGRYDGMSPSASLVIFPDLRQILGTSFIIGAAYDGSVKDAHQVKSGIWTEGSFEYGPGGMNPIGGEDFYRVNGQIAGYLPVFDLPSERNILSAYLAAYVSADYAAGGSVPIYVMQSFGGRELNGSVGYVVRGYADAGYDTRTKGYASAEFRLVGPALFGIGNLMPVLYGFGDAGYYAGFEKATVAADDSGIIASAGGGICMEVLGFAQVGVTVGARLLPDPYYTYDFTNGFFWDIQFSFHY